MPEQRPLILLTNDDGIHSPGLWAAVEAVLPLGEALVVAPNRQFSGAGRSMPLSVTGSVRSAWREVCGCRVHAYALDASPAQAVIAAMLELAPRRPSLVVSGVNPGLNLGTEVTISGTIGAALEAAAFGVPALAVSREPDPTHDPDAELTCDYGPTISFTRRFARRVLDGPLPEDAHVLSLNIPADATTTTPWCLTRLSRQRYALPVPPDRAGGHGRPGYRLIENSEEAEPDSDIWAVRVEGNVSVTPLSLDLTSRSAFRALAARLGALMPAVPDPWASLLDQPEESLTV
jgi:5'-nucleotidase